MSPEVDRLGHVAPGGKGTWCTIGTDPEGHPDQAWKVVRDVPLPGAGSLFVKSHPDSQWIWVDFGLNSDGR